MSSLQLERDLRAARHDFDDVSVSSDAWQQNQLRVAADRGRRGRALLVAAAALVLIVIVGGAVLLGGRPGGSDGMPASGDDPFGDSVVLGPPVEVETLQLDGVQTGHQAVLSDSTGKGPSLCDRFVGGTGFSGGCTSRDPNADDPAVAIDWLTGTTGSGNIRGVLAGVDSRVLKVQIWMDNGDETLAVLKPGGWEGTRVFGLTVPADGPRPQRLVAYSDASGTVLQAVDLGDRFGAGWLPSEPDCGNLAGAASVTQPLGPDPSTESAVARLGYATASVRIITDGGSLNSSHCVALGPASLASASVAGRIAVVVVGPEVVAVRVETDAGPGAVKMVVLGRSPWRVAVVRLPSPGVDGSVEVSALDTTGHVISKVPLAELRLGDQQKASQS